MLTIIAAIHAQADQADFVRAELEKLIPMTRAEQGCVQYDLHQDNEDPSKFLFYENWETRELWQEHMKAPHLAAYLEATDGFIVDFTVKEMTKLE